MYNLNVNLAATANSNTLVSNLLSVEGACTTPRTPEIVNSLIAMTNPLDNYTFGDDAPKKKANVPISSTTMTTMSSDSNSSSCSQLESPTTNATPSVEHTCSQLIKAGLKLSIEKKRKFQSDTEDILDLDKCSKRIKRNESESEEDKINANGIDGLYPDVVTGQLDLLSDVNFTSISSRRNALTPEDEERRRRRRERNKIAATKCRLKKRERTANLVTESETLETQNYEMKSQLQELERTRQRLVEVLTMHRAVCQKNIPTITRESLFNNNRLPPVSCAMEMINHSAAYHNNNNNNNRSNLDVNGYQSAAATTTTSTTTASAMYRTSNNGGDLSYNARLNGNNVQYVNKPPSIIIDGPPIDAYEPQLTNLDDPVENMTLNFNHQQCHNYNSNQNYGPSGMDNGCMA